jgi:hypothetical protein
MSSSSLTSRGGAWLTTITGRTRCARGQERSTLAHIATAPTCIPRWL